MPAIYSVSHPFQGSKNEAGTSNRCSTYQTKKGIRMSRPGSLVPYSCVFIDATWRHVFTAFRNCLHCRCSHKTEDEARQRLCREIRSCFIEPQSPRDVLVCLSVRTGFDLFLRSKRFPVGSEVIMSAINIPGMIDIVREHGLVPVPWDVDARTLSPKIALLDRLITDRSVAIVVSHLFGKRCITIDDAVETAKRRGLYFLEDCAEGFDVFGYLGHPKSDLVLFSFGTLKLYTAFGGAVCIISDRNLYNDMKIQYDSDPPQSRNAYIKKLFTTLVGCLGVNVPLVMRVGVPLCRAIDFDYKRRVIDILRGFPPGPDVWLRLRQRPSMPLLRTLRERFRTAKRDDLQKIRDKGYFVRRLLQENGMMVPGQLDKDGHDWLFPIVVKEPDLVVNRLNAMGVDAVTKATQLTVVPSDGTETEATEASDLLNHLVYLPIHKNVPFRYLRRICTAVNFAVTSHPSPSNCQEVLCKSKF